MCQKQVPNTNILSRAETIQIKSPCLSPWFKFVSQRDLIHDFFKYTLRVRIRINYAKLTKESCMVILCKNDRISDFDILEQTEMDCWRL